VIDRSITDVEFGRDYLGGKKAKTARRRILADGIPYQRDRGHFLIKQSVADAWRESRTQTPNAPNLKAMLKKISDDVLKKRAS